jgi:hypothetical protein
MPFERSCINPAIKWQNMKTRRSIRLVKEMQRADPKPSAKRDFVAGSNGWSRSVRSWVVELRERNHSQTLTRFDSLFMDALVNEDSERYLTQPAKMSKLEPTGLAQIPDRELARKNQLPERRLLSFEKVRDIRIHEHELRNHFANLLNRGSSLE